MCIRDRQIIRPTGLLDPVIEVRPVATQVDDLIGEAVSYTHLVVAVFTVDIHRIVVNDVCPVARALAVASDSARCV